MTISGYDFAFFRLLGSVLCVFRLFFRKQNSIFTKEVSTWACWHDFLFFFFENHRSFIPNLKQTLGEGNVPICQSKKKTVQKKSKWALGPLPIKSYVMSKDQRTDAAAPKQAAQLLLGGLFCSFIVWVCKKICLCRFYLLFFHLGHFCPTLQRYGKRRFCSARVILLNTVPPAITWRS